MLSLDHAGIVVPELDSAVDFWTDVFGFRQAWREQPSDVGGEALGVDAPVRIEGAILAPPGEPIAARRRAYLELHQYHEPSATGKREPFDLGYNHICLYAPDVAAEHRRLTDLGLRPFTEPQVTEGGSLEGHVWFWFPDPFTGMPIGVRNYPHPLSDRDRIGLAHPGLVVRDLDLAASWYQTMFGWALRAAEDPTDVPAAAFGLDIDGPVRITGRTLDTGSAYMELIEFISPQGRAHQRQTFDTGQGHISLFAENIDEEHARLKERGMHFFGKPSRIDHGGLEGFKWVYGTDPEGNIVELCNHPAAAHVH